MSTQEYIKKVVEDVGEDEDLTHGRWVSMVDFVNANGGIESGCLGDIKSFLKNGKLDQVVSTIKSYEGYGKDIIVGYVLILHHVLVFSSKPSLYYLDITMRNLVKVFHKDTIPRNSSGIGGSGMLDKEEIIKLLEEEE
nr:hypothetical protein [Tanacetum cinerariifolium]